MLNKLKRIKNCAYKQWHDLFHLPYNLLVYIWVIWCLFSDAINGRPKLILSSIILLLLLDFVFCLRDSSFGKNNPKFILQRTIETQTLASYFVALYGILLSFLADKGDILKAIKISNFELFAPLMFGTVSLLLLPIRIAEHRSDYIQHSKASPSMRAMLFMVMFSQQVAAISFVHVVTTIVRSMRSL
jgi:hypothetical protein